jgi:hypothetical protein
VVNAATAAPAETLRRDTHRHRLRGVGGIRSCSGTTAPTDGRRLLRPGHRPGHLGHNARQFLNSLISRRCRVITAVGTSSTAAVEAASDGAPATTFLIVGSTRRDRRNVITLDPGTGRLTDTVAASLSLSLLGGI